MLRVLVVLGLTAVAGEPAAVVRSAPGRAQSEESAQLFERATTLVCAGRFVEARALFERLAERHPTAPEAARAARRTQRSAFLGSCDLVRNGPSSNRVDVVLMGDGYELEHLRAFDQLAADVPPLFAREEPFREYYAYFNFLRAVCVSADSGVDGFGREYDTALGGRTLGTDAGHVGIDGPLVARTLGEIEDSDGLAMIFVKLGVLGTGGAGSAVIGGRDARTTIHEWGHAFAGLGDEYDVRTHERSQITACANVSATDDPKLVPWRHWLAAKHPSIGIYEGAAGRVRDAWRPTASGCRMNTGEFFCPVCREAILLRIYSIVDPIESASPTPPPAPIREPVVLQEGAVEFEVRVMRPATHVLETRWWVQPESHLPTTGADRDTGPARTAEQRALAAPPTRAIGRGARGPLAPIVDDPLVVSLHDADGTRVLRLTRSDLEPGRYRVVCRVRDTTRIRDEKWPWVLSDEDGVLESERVWWLLVR